MLSRLFHRLGQACASRRVLRPEPRRLLLETLEARDVPATIFAIAPGNQLFIFDSSGASGGFDKTVTGLGPNETIRGLDFRPRTGQLIASTVATNSTTSVIKTYSIDPMTAAATFIGMTGNTNAGDEPSGYDFNPTVDRIRLVNDVGVDLRLNPNNGTLAGLDTNLTFTAPATGPIIAEAYNFNFDHPSATGSPVNTTLFGIDAGSGRLVRQGGVGGTPSPNGGVITSVGPLGFTLAAGRDGGVDILDSTDNGGQGTAFAALTSAADNLTRFYTINLTTGAATPIGLIGGTGTMEIYSIAAVPSSALVIGSGPGANADVRSLDPARGRSPIGTPPPGLPPGEVRLSIDMPFPGFTGGTRVATGDVNRDGIPDVIVTAVSPQGHVKVFDGVTGLQLPGFIGSFFAFEGFNGDVNVGAGDVNGDGFDDVIVSANGVSGHVKAFSGADGSLLASFLAYDGFLGNVTVASADFNKDGTAEIVTAAAINGHVKVFEADGTAFAPVGAASSFFAFSPYLGDVSIAAGDVNGDGVPDFVVCSGPGVALNVRAYSGVDGSPLSSFLPTGLDTYTGGGHVALTDVAALNQPPDGRYEIVVTLNAGVASSVDPLNLSGQRLFVIIPGFENFLGGTTVAGVRY